MYCNCDEPRVSVCCSAALVSARTSGNVSTVMGWRGWMASGAGPRGWCGAIGLDADAVSAIAGVATVSSYRDQLRLLVVDCLRPRSKRADWAQPTENMRWLGPLEVLHDGTLLPPDLSPRCPAASLGTTS